jgi:hypothetical protein
VGNCAKRYYLLIAQKSPHLPLFKSTAALADSPAQTTYDIRHSSRKYPMEPSPPAAQYCLDEPSGFQEESMNTQVGERYKCSDANCACEIEVTKPSRMQNESFGSGSMNAGSISDRSQSNQPIGGQATSETGASPTGVGSLRNAESAGISTPGDFGSQGATGEGVFGTSGGNQRSTASGRLGSTTGSTLKSGSRSSGSSTSNIETGSSGESNFYCACGQLMQKTQSSRAARM